METDETKKEATDVTEEVTEVTTDDVAAEETTEEVEVLDEVETGDYADFDYKAFEGVDPDEKSRTRYNNILSCILAGVIVAVLIILVCAISIESRVENHNNEVMKQLEELKERIPELNENTSEVTGPIVGVSREVKEGKESFFVVVNYRAVEITENIYNELSGYIGEVVTLTETTTTNEEENKETKFLSYYIHPVG